MAMVEKFLSNYQLAALMKCQAYLDSDECFLEEFVREGRPDALQINRCLLLCGYGLYDDCWFMPATRVLTRILDRLTGRGKKFVPVDENLLCVIPANKKRWRQIDRCHRRWGWVD